jgi:hypothetical protein
LCVRIKRQLEELLRERRRRFVELPRTPVVIKGGSSTVRQSLLRWWLRPRLKVRSFSWLLIKVLQNLSFSSVSSSSSLRTTCKPSDEVATRSACLIQAVGRTICQLLVNGATKNAYSDNRYQHVSFIWTRGVFAFSPSRSKSTNQADIRYPSAYGDELIQICHDHHSIARALAKPIPE